MRFDAFIGPSYTLQTPQADLQKTRNLYVEMVASGQGRNRVVLYGRPGLSVLITLPDSPLRGLFSLNGRCFAVAGGTFGEIVLTSATTALFINQTAGLPNDGTLVWIASNGASGNQVLVVVSGFGYIYDLNANTLTKIADVDFPANAFTGLFSDGYFLVLQKATSTLYSSALEDGTSWNGVDVAQRSTASDAIQCATINHRELWLFGSQTTEVWYDTGASTGFPYAPIPGAFIEQGAFPYSVQNLDNAPFWVGQNLQGQAVAYRADGYFPKRVSNSGVEFAWSQYVRADDVETYAYQEQGHTFWVLNFPTANKTWIYDVSTDMWSEADWYNAVTQAFERILPRCHALFGGLHLVGDRQSGNVYIQSLASYDDAGTRIHRVRRAPHISNEKLWTYYQQFVLDCEVGQGTPADLQYDPQAILRWSNDGGYTWSNDYQQSLGKQGEYKKRLIWNRLGRARDRVFELEISEPMCVRLINAYLDIEQGIS